MRTKLLGYVTALTVGYALCGVAVAQPRSRNPGTKAASDKTIDKQMEWENRVMGDDSQKRSDLKKIAAAQKLADEAAKHPPPIAAPKVKDPSKEGVRAKQEAAIGLPIASDKDSPATRKSTGATKKVVQPTSSANDELGALVASSLAENKSTTANTVGHSNKNRVQRGAVVSKGRGKARGKGRAETPGAAASPSSLDQMFAAGQ